MRYMFESWAFIRFYIEVIYIIFNLKRGLFPLKCIFPTAKNVERKSRKPFAAVKQWLDRPLTGKGSISAGHKHLAKHSCCVPKCLRNCGDFIPMTGSYLVNDF